MKTFNYRIVGRTAGIIEPIGYTGHVIALTLREAILAALVAEFGDPDTAKPLVNRICDGGWIDEPTLYDHFADLADEASSLSLDSGDYTFDIVVRSSIGGVQ
jgi:hypothetical protein